MTGRHVRRADPAQLLVRVCLALAAVLTALGTTLVIAHL